MNELDVVVVTRSLPEFALEAGDVGTVVHVYENGRNFEVEFVSAGGKTVALLTLAASDLRLMNEREILHARKLAS
jgi:hypothetical protein